MHVCMLACKFVYVCVHGMSDDEFIFIDIMLFLAWVCNVYAKGSFENRRSKTPLLLLQYEQGPVCAVWRLTDAPGN